MNTDGILKDNTAWDIDGDGKLDVSGSGFFTNETAEMKALRQLYQNTPGSQYEKSGYYLFMVDRADASGEPDEAFAVQGDMPRGKQFGYLFTTSADNIGRLAAHELGHGIFTLPHTFDVNLLNNDSKGQTSNLMDYDKLHLSQHISLIELFGVNLIKQLHLSVNGMKSFWDIRMDFRMCLKNYQKMI